MKNSKNQNHDKLEEENGLSVAEVQSFEQEDNIRDIFMYKMLL